MPMSDRKVPSDQSVITSGGMKNIVELWVNDLHFAGRAVMHEMMMDFLW
jgi:hypothetical protein